MAKARKATKRAPARAKAGRTPAKKVSPVPAGYHTATPYLTVSDGVRALEFYARAFGARETERMPGPGGKLMHAEMRIGDSVIMLSDELPMSTCKAPTTLGGTTASVMLYLPDVDRTFQQAVAAGCRVLMPPTDMFWGDRFGKLEDPFGNQWGVATHKEDVPPRLMAERARAAMAQTGQASA